LRVLRPILVVLPFVLLGCGTGPHPPTAWVCRLGGLARDARQGRAEAMLARLVDRAAGARPRAYVLASDETSAYSWPDGSVVVTSGLVDRLDDDELLAAIAHELGHLVDGGHLTTGVSLRGCERGGTCVDDEERADAIGVALLQARCVTGRAMASMLAKVARSQDPASPCARALARRIDVLEARLGRPAVGAGPG
jgi:Zn-dependent protease with chaperone function